MNFEELVLNYGNACSDTYTEYTAGNDTYRKLSGTYFDSIMAEFDRLAGKCGISANDIVCDQSFLG